jgi:phenylalanyl-tRNA synthetase beta chain
LPKEIRISLETVEKIAGFSFKESEAEKYFSYFSDKVRKIKKGVYQLEINTLRRDLEILEDVAEELIRFKGYSKILSAAPLVKMRAPEIDKEFLMRKAFQDALVKLGFDEVLNYSFVGSDEFSFWGYAEKELIQVTEPASGNYSYLRPNILVNLAKNIALNNKFFDKVRIFEIGKVFSRKNSLPEESWRIGLAVSEAKDPKELFLEIKGIIEGLFEILNLEKSSLNFGAVKKEYLEPEMQSEVLFQGEKIGHFGLLKERLASFYGLERPVVLLSLAPEKLYPEVKPVVYEQIEKYPVVKRDISFFVGPEIGFAQVLKQIKSVDSRVLEGIELFDIFEKGNKNSFSFHLIFRSKNRTLRDEEADKEMRKIIKRLQKLGAEIR